MSTIVRYTNAPEVYDYAATVIASDVQPYRASCGMNSQHPFRKVTLDAAEQEYYARYQCDRYRSGSYVVIDPDQWEAWIADGFIVPQENDHAAGA